MKASTSQTWKIQLSPLGFGSIRLEEEELSHHVTALQYEAHAGHSASLTPYLKAEHVEITGDGPVTFMVGTRQFHVVEVMSPDDPRQDLTDGFFGERRLSGIVHQDESGVYDDGA
jgi:hypothetical protein